MLQGDEIGMENTEISWEDTIDPAGCNCGPDKYQECSRDPERTPMQWSAEKNAGFSQAESTWLPVNPNYETLNVEAQLEASESHLKVYKSLSALRATDARVRIGYSDTFVQGDMLGIARHIDYNAILFIFNASDQENSANFHPGNLEGTSKVIFRSTGSDNPSTEPGKEINLRTLTLKPFEAIVVDFQLK